MSPTDFSQTASYATALPAGRGPSQGRWRAAPPSRSDASGASTLDEVAAGKTIASLKRFGARSPLIFLKRCLNLLTHSAPAPSPPTPSRAYGGPKEAQRQGSQKKTVFRFRLSPLPLDRVQESSLSRRWQLLASRGRGRGLGFLRGARLRALVNPTARRVALTLPT